MIESIVVTLREGVEAALVVAILIAYLSRIGRNELNRFVYNGVLAAVLGSVAAAWVFQRIAINQEAFEGVLLLVAAVFVTTFLLWMHRAARYLRAEIESRVDRVLARGSRRAVGAGLFLLTFIMILREGVETVIFLGAISMSTDSLWALLGAVVGLALSVVFAVLFVRGSLRINLRRFFQVTEVVLLLFVLQLLINSYHELSEAGWVPAGPGSMAVVGPIVSYNIVFIFAILAIPVLAFLFARPAAEADAGQEERGPELRKRLAASRRALRVRRATAAIGLFILAFLSLDFVYSSDVPSLDPAVPLEAREGMLRIPVAMLADGGLHRFAYRLDGTDLRLLAIKTGEDRYATALDACELCGPLGYYQDGDRVICLNCTADIYVPTIGRAGGCNPIPLPSVSTADSILVDIEVLAEHVEVFR